MQVFNMQTPCSCDHSQQPFALYCCSVFVIIQHAVWEPTGWYSLFCIHIPALCTDDDVGVHLLASGTASDFKPLLDALSSSKTSLVEDFNAIGTAVHTLQPLLARMQQLQANKAAAHAGATAALSAGGDIAAVERRVRQQMAETAGCMHTLQELRQVLMPVDDQPAV